MGLAAVRPSDDPRGPAVLVESDMGDISLGQTVEAEIHGEKKPCRVVATPDQILGASDGPQGHVLAVLPDSHGADYDVEEILDSHPSSRVPHLGEVVETSGGVGWVRRLDVPKAVVTVELDSGDTVTLSASEIRRHPA